MKKIGIITLNGYYNFGNRLQNYALTDVLQKMGYNVDTIWSGEEINLKSKIQFLIISYFPYNKKWKRERKFLKFTKKYMNRVNYNNSINNKYDIYVVGSDQVWNYESVKNNTNYLVPFSTDQKLIAYAVSLGNSYLPHEYYDLYKKYITRFDYISVREENGKKIIKDDLKIQKEINVLIDPTLLIDKNQWMSIEKKPKKIIPRNYILCYFLGDYDLNIKQTINNYAKENNLLVINLLDYKDKFFCSGPREFLYLIRNASLVCTDSFHSCVFSFIYNRPFIVFKRTGENNKMYSRIEEFLKKFKFKDREYNNVNISEKNLKYDYQESYKILKAEKKKAISFLNISLK